MIRIDCDGVAKRFTKSAAPQLVSWHLFSLLRGSLPEEAYFYALRNVSFQVLTGEFVAIIGNNGAGKSTLLSLISGLADPDNGRISVNGITAPLLELGSGFHSDLTGRENLLLNAALLGFSRADTLSRIDEIVSFAGIGDFIHQPLRTYSTGMMMRLAFSIAVNLNPDILIIDEVLAVGDHAFQEKCFSKVMEFRRAGKTIVAVSHATTMVTELCDRAIWLDRGRLIMDGEIQTVLQRYHEAAGQPVDPISDGPVRSITERMVRPSADTPNEAKRVRRGR